MTGPATGPETGPVRPGRRLWIDASAGVAGDMLLAALVDTGAPESAIQAAIDSVLPGQVRLATSTVTRAGQRARRAEVELLGPAAPEAPALSWRGLRDLLSDAALAEPVRARALAVFTRLADAEARVHGTDPDDVHFHEAGAADSVADVVGVCQALAELDVGELGASALALGSGRVRTAHGELPVPVPAVLELTRGWPVFGGGTGELATPTGAALVTTLAQPQPELPALTVSCVGVGAGARDTPGRANVVRVVLGEPASTGAEPTGGHAAPMWVLEANVDDLDPRVWPSVLTALLAAGAADAWLTPILMKKGRPAHQLEVLAAPAHLARLRQQVFTLTSTIGLREYPVTRWALDREWHEVAVHGGTVRIKVSRSGERVLQAVPEYDDVAALAARSGLPVRAVLEAAVVAAAAAGLTPAPAPGPAPGEAPDR